MSARKNVQARGGATAAGKTSGGFTKEERAAMQERVRELKAEGKDTLDGEAEVLAKIEEMRDPDRAMARRLHALIKGSSPEITARTWYGMPAYARDGNVVCFFKPAQKFKARYATLGFSDKAKLDEGAMWPTEYALTELTSAEEARIVELVRKALG